MKFSTQPMLFACFTIVQVLLFSTVARLPADEPPSAEAKQPSDQKAATATIQFSDVLVNLDEVEVKPLTEAAGLTFTLDNAVEAEPRFWLGVALDRLDDTLRLHLGIASGTGLIVTGVENESPAAKAGIMLNDLLLKLDYKPVASVEELAAQIQEIGEKSVPLELLRRGKPATLTVSPEKRALQCFVVHLENAELISALTLTAEPMAIEVNLDGGAIVLEAQPIDLAKRVADLQEQVKQLQKSIDALDAAVKAQSAAAGGQRK